MKTIKSIMFAVLLVITLATTIVAIHFATKYNQAMKCLDNVAIEMIDGSITKVPMEAQLSPEGFIINESLYRGFTIYFD